jgi:uncharacterized protein with HEPN domain
VSPRDWRYRVEDILEAIANAQSYVEGMTSEDFTADTKTTRAAAYEIGVVGEAVGHIPAEVRQRHPEVPWGKMQAMRNIVVHEYFRVDIGILWQTIQQDLPPLVPLLQAVLEDAVG